MSSGSATNYWSFGPRADGSVGFYYPSVVRTTTATVAENQWSHIAAVKSSAGLRLFVNGVGQLFAISGTPSLASTPLTIGQYQTTCINGYIDDLRITKGVARYSADFSVPTEAYPDSLLELQTPQIVTAHGINPAVQTINRIHYQGL
jgi:hypothetical protein